MTTAKAQLQHASACPELCAEAIQTLMACSAAAIARLQIYKCCEVEKGWIRECGDCIREWFVACLLVQKEACPVAWVIATSTADA